jgi:phosphatidylserine/phosphatidylglycerophosphate/cardiolipin synthase-like enzyme
MYAVVPDKQGGEKELVIHSKLLIVDDHFIRIGSSNLNNRSEGLDTECDLAIEASTNAHRLAISTLRYRLLAEHLETTPETVRETERSLRSLNSAVDALNVGKRGLRHFAIDVSKGETSPLTGTTLVDPRRPYWPLQKLRLRVGRLAAAIF